MSLTGQENFPLWGPRRERLRVPTGDDCIRRPERSLIHNPSDCPVFSVSSTVKMLCEQPLIERLSELAVVQGGVWRSLCPEKISKRLSETSYGFRQTESYTEDWPYGGPGPVQNPVTGVIEMEDRMNWVIKKV
jgi:hypothetical protein